MSSHARSSNLVRCMLALLLYLWVTPMAVPADGAHQETVAKIKAAYLLNFLRFADWPDNAFDTVSSPLNVCVLGQDTLGNILDVTMREQEVSGRTIAVRRIDAADKSAWQEDLHDCHLAFITRSEASRSEHIVAELRGSDTLTVGETASFALTGTMLALNFEDDRIIFYANPGAIRAANVRLSSKILQLARIIDDNSSAARN